MALTNAQMKPRRFLDWHIARKRIAWIKAHLEAGNNVYLCTYTRATRFTPKHLAGFDEWFRATKTGGYVARGKQWDNFDGSALRAEIVEPKKTRRRKAA